MNFNKPLQTLGGSVLKPTFDPSLVANFQEKWDETFHQTWRPIYKKDMKVNQNYDFFRNIVNRVKIFGESYDMTVVGDRGLGKSAFGLGAAQIMNCEFKGDYSAKFDINNVCFDVDAWIAVCDGLKGTGGVVILDEVGTEGSLSSRTSMSKGNRSSADVIQLMRTDRIITIYISTDRDRIDKRVRQLTSVMGTPIAKLNNEQTNGYGLAIEADIKYRRTRPAGDRARDKRSETDAGYLQHEVSPLLFAPKGKIYSVVVPHAPIDMWIAYGIKRDQKLEGVRIAAFDHAIQGKNSVESLLASLPPAPPKASKAKKTSEIIERAEKAATKRATKK